MLEYRRAFDVLAMRGWQSWAKCEHAKNIYRSVVTESNLPAEWQNEVLRKVAIYDLYI